MLAKRFEISIINNDFITDIKWQKFFNKVMRCLNYIGKENIISVNEYDVNNYYRVVAIYYWDQEGFRGKNMDEFLNTG